MAKKKVREKKERKTEATKEQKKNLELEPRKRQKFL